MSLAVFAEYKVCMVTNGSNMLDLTAHCPYSQHSKEEEDTNIIFAGDYTKILYLE